MSCLCPSVCVLTPSVAAPRSFVDEYLSRASRRVAAEQKSTPKFAMMGRSGGLQGTLFRSLVFCLSLATIIVGTHGQTACNTLPPSGLGVTVDESSCNNVALTSSTSYTLWVCGSNLVLFYWQSPFPCASVVSKQGRSYQRYFGGSLSAYKPLRRGRRLN